MAKARPSPMDGLYFETRPIHSHNHPGAPVIPKPYYNYGYSVQDEYSGNNYNAQETADGKYQSTNVIEAYLNKATPPPPLSDLQFNPAGTPCPQVGEKS